MLRAVQLLGVSDIVNDAADRFNGPLER
ncbi:hypothetical protein DSM3645_27181 [Blastopirellula marina DSM 3645]|uniref:Uncharacterized protein n=1 Tax=Blastopirellula marina DSM 3645 TaxID=314230 RepID=A3ZZY9_9BACT|nr:hypothetical protein DSM3645_27181 [Blastopirellula marina DSM 3645]